MKLAEDVFIAPNAELIGDVSMAAHSSVWFSSILRAVGAPVSLGVGADVQDNCVVESFPGSPANVGDHSSMGHGATVRGSILEDHVLIAMNATVMPGCHIGTGSIVAANAIVPPNTVVPPRSLVIGAEGRIPREVTEAEHQRIVSTSHHYMQLAKEYREGLSRRDT